MLFVFLLTVNILDAQNLKRGFRLINDGKMIAAKQFFGENSDLCLSKAGLLKIIFSNNELLTETQLTHAYIMAYELTECYTHLPLIERKKYSEFISGTEIINMLNSIDKKYYTFLINSRNSGYNDTYLKTCKGSSYYKLIYSFADSCEFSNSINNLSGYRIYLKKYPDGKHTREALSAIEDLTYTNSVNVNTIGAYSDYLNKYPEGKYVKDVNESIVFLNAKEKNRKDIYESYLVSFPAGRYKNEVSSLIEKLDFEEAKSNNSEEAIQKYLRIYPNGYFKKEALEQIEKIYYDEAKTDNTIESYNVFLKKYPNGVYNKDALTGIETIKGKAIVKISYPSVVLGGFRYSWNTYFTESGGYVGYDLKAYNFYIEAPNGSHYSNSWSSTVRVEPGGSNKINYWCDKSDNWAGGFFYCEWRGSDDKGNDIEIVQKVKLEK
jgi:outer membrane protein assembly factor BamD (BamD/ComL family)